jgi:8-oxo-dGTP pyrophosphatase MutT (NUDIX family)
VKLKPWEYTGREITADARIFTLYRETAVSPRTGKSREIAHIASPEWVNVVPITTAGEVLLVRQWRHGRRTFTLEIPGGLVDPGEDPSAASAREVREETGYSGGDPQRLGVVTPNPAFMNNRCYTYLIEECRPVGELELDPGEDLEVVPTPLVNIAGLIAGGEIDHALVICGFWWLRQNRPDLWP